MQFHNAKIIHSYYKKKYMNFLTAFQNGWTLVFDGSDSFQVSGKFENIP